LEWELARPEAGAAGSGSGKRGQAAASARRRLISRRHVHELLGHAYPRERLGPPLYERCVPGARDRSDCASAAVRASSKATIAPQRRADQRQGARPLLHGLRDRRRHCRDVALVGRLEHRGAETFEHPSPPAMQMPWRSTPCPPRPRSRLRARPPRTAPLDHGHAGVGDFALVAHLTGPSPCRARACQGDGVRAGVQAGERGMLGRRERAPTKTSSTAPSPSSPDAIPRAPNSTKAGHVYASGDCASSCST
jgi:hypothetical protein